MSNFKISYYRSKDRTHDLKSVGKNMGRGFNFLNLVERTHLVSRSVTCILNNCQIQYKWRPSQKVRVTRLLNDCDGIMDNKNCDGIMDSKKKSISAV